jgi:aspartate-semialdehyde dehydrogenase
MSSSKKIPVAVVGATGLAGQQFLVALARHPRFEIVKLAASSRSAGKPYREAIRETTGQLRWYAGPQPWGGDDRIGGLMVEDAAQLDARGLGVVFSAVESEPARELEPKYAEHTAVVSTASAFRYEPDVPIVIPGVNLGHLKLIEAQRKKRGWKGFITPNPNCTTTGLAITLAPLHERFGVTRVFMTSMQAVSGAGRSPGVIALDIVDNVVPYIAKEEEKVEKETKKILGALRGESIEPANFSVSCTCTRVPVLEGHTESVFVELAKPAGEAEIRQAWREFGAAFTAKKFPSSPERLVHVLDDPYRPQPRLDRDTEDGMATTVGRLRKDDSLGAGTGWKYMLVSHNTKMGAAKGAVLVAEHLDAEGYL